MIKVVVSIFFSVLYLFCCESPEGCVSPETKFGFINFETLNASSDRLIIDYYKVIRMIGKVARNNILEDKLIITNNSVEISVIRLPQRVIVHGIKVLPSKIILPKLTDKSTFFIICIQRQTTREERLLRSVLLNRTNADIDLCPNVYYDKGFL